MLLNAPRQQYFTGYGSVRCPLPLRAQPTFAALTERVKKGIEAGQIDTYTFVPTPDALIDRMIMAAELKPTMRILEPSAGQGHIIDRLRDYYSKTFYGLYPNVEAVEINDILRQELRDKHIPLVGRDILDYKRGPVYDRIFMNPPYANGLDIKHTLHCYTLLKPGGKLIAIMPESAFYPANREKPDPKWSHTIGGKTQEINAFLEDLFAQVEMGGGQVRTEKIDAGGFTASDVSNATVKTRLMVITKPAL